MFSAFGDVDNGMIEIFNGEHLQEVIAKSKYPPRLLDQPHPEPRIAKYMDTGKAGAASLSVGTGNARWGQCWC